MDKKLLLQKRHNPKSQRNRRLQNPRDLKMVLGSLSWNILTLLSQKAMYPLEIARQLGCTSRKFTITSENSKNQAP
jgi:hypothetical protein